MTSAHRVSKRFFSGNWMKTKPNFQKINQTSCKWKTKPNNYAYLCSFNWSARGSRTISFHSICFSFFRFFSTGLGDVHHRVAFVLVWKVWTRSVMRTYWTDSLMFYCVWLSLTKRWFGEIKTKKSSHTWFFHINAQLFIKSNGIRFSCSTFIVCNHFFYLRSVFSLCSLFGFFFSIRLSTQKFNKMVRSPFHFNRCEQFVLLFGGKIHRPPTLHWVQMNNRPSN